MQTVYFGLKHIDKKIMDYSRLSQEERDKILKNDLSAEKIKFAEKYALYSSPDLKWYTNKNNTPARLYFSHQFFKTNGILEIVFRKYQLCFAKLKYFRVNINKYEFFKYAPIEGFIKTDLWDIEFFRHTKSNIFIDLRYLQQITEIDKFEELINYLEALS